MESEVRERRPGGYRGPYSTAGVREERSENPRGRNEERHQVCGRSRQSVRYLERLPLQCVALPLRDRSAGRDPTQPLRRWALRGHRKSNPETFEQEVT